MPEGPFDKSQSYNCQDNYNPVHVAPNLPSAVDAGGDLLLRLVQVKVLVVPLKAEKESQFQIHFEYWWLSLGCVSKPQANGNESKS